MKTALVTGGAKRLGKAISLKLADMGYRIALHYNSTEPKDLVEEITSKGVECKTYKMNLNENFDLIKVVSKDFKLDVLINNASIFEMANILDTTKEMYNNHMNINLKAPFFISRDFAQLSKGNIINILDTKIVKDKTEHSVYLMTKKSLGDFTKMCAKEFAPSIRVNGIAPGLILPPPGKGDEYLNQKANDVPLKKTGSVSDITNAVEYLLTNEFLTGQIIYVDGGDHLC